MLELAKSLINQINQQRWKTEKDVEYYRGAVEGLELLLQKANEQQETEQRKSSQPVAVAPEETSGD